MKSRTLTASLFASVALLTTVNGASIDAGRTSFANNCAICHGTPPDWIRPAAQGGANNPSAIKAAIRSEAQMRFLSTLSDAEIANIAIYIGNFNSSDSDRVFNWAEKQFPTLLTPATRSDNGFGYYYRFYSGTNVYVGTKDQRVFFYNPAAGSVLDVGGLSDYLGQAEAGGF
ncbi:c-type cytochrome [Parachitinimonas caeni]|uniref:Cytochrome c domain-containing protein n=1 Tax=Parachitinimonas caeni TaxID=3031301 RepID=A0ABT7DXY3_9NEIS|nr:c-type cytochrome [Parachitinimonas caeni]MDK2124859.1 hypothetical protein [Parachitinimonas caeni]